MPQPKQVVCYQHERQWYFTCFTCGKQRNPVEGRMYAQCKECDRSPMLWRVTCPILDIVYVKLVWDLLR